MKYPPTTVRSWYQHHNLPKNGSKDHQMDGQLAYRFLIHRRNPNFMTTTWLVSISLINKLLKQAFSILWHLQASPERWKPKIQSWQTHQNSTTKLVSMKIHRIIKFHTELTFLSRLFYMMKLGFTIRTCFSFMHGINYKRG